MMKNSNILSLVLSIGILIVLGCSCPNKIAELQKEIEKGKTKPGPYASPTPTVTGTAREKAASSDLTLAKYEQLKNGMSYEDAVAIMGSKGSETASSGDGKYRLEVYKWEGPNFQYVMLTFIGGKMNSKSQNGLK